MLLPSKAFISTYISLVYAQPSSKILFYVFFILNLDLKLNIVLDQQLIQAEGEDSRLRETIIGKDNLLSKIIGMTNILNFSRSSNPIIIYVVVVGLLLMSAWIAGKLFIPKKISALAKHSGESERKIEVSNIIISILLHYFEYFFLLITRLFLSMIICVNSEAESQTQTSTAQFSLAASDISNAIGATIEQTASNQTLSVQVVYSTPHGCTSLACYSVSHIALIIMCSAIMVMSIFFKYVSTNLESSWPNPNYPRSKYGRIDNVHGLIFSAIMVTQIFFIKRDSSALKDQLPTFYTVCAVLFILDCAMQTGASPFYSPLVNSLRLAETIVCGLVSIIALASLKSNADDPPKLLFKNYPVILLLSFMLFVTHRLVGNVSFKINEKRSQQIFANANNRRILEFVYKGIRYCNQGMLDRDDGLTLETKEFQSILFEFLALRKIRSRKRKQIEAANNNKDDLPLQDQLQDWLELKIKDLEEGGPDNSVPTKDGNKNGDVSTGNLNRTDQLKNDALNISGIDSPVKTLRRPSAPNVFIEDTKVGGGYSKDSMKLQALLNDIKAPNSADVSSSRSPNKSQEKILIHDNPNEISFNKFSAYSSRSNFFAIGEQEDEGLPPPSPSERANKSQQLAVNDTVLFEFQNNDRTEVAEEMLDNSNNKNSRDIYSLRSKVGSKSNTGQTSSNLEDRIEEIKKMNRKFNARAEASNNMYNDRSQFYLLNTVEESRRKGVRLPVILMNRLLEDHLETLTQGSSTDFAKLTEILIVYTYFKTVYLGAVYQVALKVRAIEANFTHNAKTKEKIRRYSLFEMLYGMLTRSVKHNLATGHLILPHTRHLLNVDNEQDHALKLADCVTFINVYTQIKSEIRKICDNRTAFINNLLSEGADSKLMFNHAKKLAKLREPVLRKFKELISRCGSKFTPLMMLYGTFLSHIEQDTHRARKVIQSFINKPFFFDLRTVTSINLDKNEEMMTMGVSVEKQTFHRINMATSNVFFYLQYDAFELIGQDLAILIPNPLAEYHYRLMDPKKITGKLFELKIPRAISVRKKNGFLTTCKIVVRMNYRVSDSLEVFAAMIFDKTAYGMQKLLVVDETMLITEMSEAATDYFDRTTYMYQYQRSFAKIFYDLNYVSNFRLKNESTELHALMTDKKILNSYNTYFQFMNGDEMEITDKLGRPTTIFIQITVTYMPSIQKFLRFLQFEVKKNEDDDEFEDNEAPENAKDDLFSFYARDNLNGRMYQNNPEIGLEQEAPKFNPNEMKYPNKKRKYNYALLSGEELKLKRLLEYLKGSSLIKNAWKNNDVLKNTLTTKKSLKNMVTKVVERTSTLHRKKTVASPIQSTLHRIGTLREHDDLKSSAKGTKFSATSDIRMTPSNLKLSETETNKQRQVQEKTLPKNRFFTGGAQSSTKSRFLRISRKEMADQAYIEVVRLKRDNRYTNIMFSVLQFIFVVAVVSQALIGFIKYSSMAKVRMDVQQRGQSIDLSVWALQAAVKLTEIIEWTSAADSGLIADTALQSMGISNIDAYYRNNSHWMISATKILSDQLDMRMINVSFSEAEQLDLFTHDKDIMGYLSVYRLGGVTDLLQPTVVGARILISYLQPDIDNLLINFIANGDFDPALRAKVRLNIGGDLTDYMFKRTIAASQYFESVTQETVEYIQVLQVWAIVSIVILLLLVMIYSALIWLKMSQFYHLMFEFKVGCALTIERNNGHREQTVAQDQKLYRGAAH